MFYTSYDEHNKCRLFSWSEINYILCFDKVILHEHISNWNHYGVSFYMQYNQKLDLHSWKDSNITSLCSMKGHSRTVRCVLVGLITSVILMYCICSNHTYFYIWTSSHIQTFTKQLILCGIYKNFASFVSSLEVFLFFQWCKLVSIWPK